MPLRNTLLLLLIISHAALSAQTQSWQWVKAGGSSSDNGTSPHPAECKIAGCDAYGNVYAVGWINGPNMRFDTFTSPGCYNNVGISYLLFSYDCSGNMRWAKQIGDYDEDLNNFGVVTDPSGNTYFAGQFYYGYFGGIVNLSLGDSLLIPTPPMITQPYLCMAKYDSLGKLVWFKNFQEDTAYNPHVGSFQTVPFGLRLGSSGNLWMLCNLDSDYIISPTLHTSLYGMYNLEIDPNAGNILSGYYVANQPYGYSYDIDTYWDLDENENFYQTGTLVSGDTLILSNQKIAADPSPVRPFIFSVDKTGNFRYLITNKNYTPEGDLSSCKYDFQSQRLINCWGLSSGVIYGNDTFSFNSNNMNGGSTSVGLLTIDPSGNILWGKYITRTTNDFQFVFDYVPTPFYIDHVINNSLSVYNNTDTIFNGINLSSNDYTKVISRIDVNGNLIATYTANEGNLNGINGSNGIKYGATDWRGNVYLGGTVTNYFATPADSVVNRDTQSGNFFIAKLGISDCSCPTPGIQFTQTAHGDTVSFFGSSINHSDSIHWEFGDGSVSNKDSLVHAYAHDSIYTVTAIAYSGCGVDSITKQITVRSTGIKTVEPTATNLYPNPAINSVNLDVSGTAMIGLIYANGSSVWQSPVQVSQQGTYVFDMSKYACAMYYFIVQYTNGKTDVMQVVKE